MGLETVVERILATGKSEAGEIVRRGKEERERILAEVREEGRRLAERRQAEARETAERRRIQDLARAELDAKRLVLGAREDVLQTVRELVRSRLTSASQAESLRRLLAKHATDWRSGRVYARTADESAVRSIVGGSFAGTRDMTGGVVIESADGSSRLDLTFGTLLDDLWDDVVKEVAGTLWP